jgi:hypothetical protein
VQQRIIFNLATHPTDPGIIQPFDSKHANGAFEEQIVLRTVGRNFEDTGTQMPASQRHRRKAIETAAAEVLRRG